MNLLDETRQKLLMNDKSFDDVRWIGSRDGRMVISKENWVERMDITYDGGFGAQEICTDLVVVGDDWWLERHEYDGSEWWEFKRHPVLQGDAREVRKITGMWDTLEEVDEDEDRD